MAGENDVDIPDTGALFTFGRSRFADNIPSHFYIRNDPILEVACGDEYTTIICQKGRVFVFGNNDYGQLGLGHKNVTVKPSCIKSLKPEKAISVACGRAHTLLSTGSGKLFSWGNNSDGQLGVGDIADRSAPTRVMGIQDDITQLTAGCVSSAALTARGQVYVWGSNSDGQLGLQDVNDNVLSPTLLPFDQRIVDISCGYYHTAFVTESGALYTCGESESGKLGLPDSLTNITTPQKVTLGVPIKSVFCGGNHTIALTVDGEVFAFGNNFNGQLGLGVEVSQNILPAKVISLEGHVISGVACGESHTTFITDRGNLYTCGEGRHGKLCSEQDNNNQIIPTKVAKFKGYTVKKVACGGCHTMVLANERRMDEAGLDLISQSLDSENEENSSQPVTNRNALPPLQRVPIQNANNNNNNNLETNGSLNENLNNHLEDLTDQSSDMKIIDKDFETKSTLSGSRNSSDEIDDDIDADIDEELSLKSAKPEMKTDQSEKEINSTPMDVIENLEIEDEIKDIDDKIEGDESDSDSDEDNEDNADVTTESEEKKEGRVARFFSAFRRKKPTSAQSVGLEGCGERLSKRQRAASEGRVRREQGGGDAQDRGDSGISTKSNVGNEKKIQGIPPTSRSISTAIIRNERSTKKRQQKVALTEQRNFLKVCNEAIRNANNDDIDVFGVYVGKKLKAVTNESQKILAETLIMQILQKTVLNKLTENTTIVDNGPVLRDDCEVHVFSPSSNNSDDSYFCTFAM